MDLFPDGGYVKLQSQVHSTFLHAGEDGRTVLLDALKNSCNAVWVVERCHISGIVRLRGAYGRYLGSPQAPSSYLPCPWVAGTQLDFDELNFDEKDKKEIMWRVVMKREGVVELESALGPFLRPGVCFSGCRRSREWKVHGVPQTHIRPFPPPPCTNKWPFSFKREIHWLLAERSGEIHDGDDDAWGKFTFVGRNLTVLEHKIRRETKDFPMTIFVRAGCHGTLAPLCVNLPRNQDPVYFIGLWGPSAAEPLFFPNIGQAEADVEDN